MPRKFNQQRTEPRTASKVVRELFDIARQDRVRIIDIATALSMTSAGVQLWKAGKCTPDMMAVEAMAEILGYRVVLERIGSDGEKEN